VIKIFILGYSIAFTPPMILPDLRPESTRGSATLAALHARLRGRAWTPPLTKRLLRPFGNPTIGSHVASHGAYSVAVKLQSFHQIDPLPPPYLT